MPEKENIKLEELIGLVNHFNKQEITLEELNNFGNNMMIKTYIPLMDKVGLVMSISIQYLYSTEIPEMRIANLYKDLFFRVLLEQYALIDCDNSNLITLENYDLLYPVFMPFLSAYCQDDYNTIVAMIKDNINLNNIEHLLDSLNDIDYEALKQSTLSNKSLLKEMENNKDVIRDLKDIAVMNDPMTGRIVENIKAQFVEKANNK